MTNKIKELLAYQVTNDLFGNDGRKWKEAKEAVRLALNARIALWDSILENLSILTTTEWKQNHYK